MKAISKFLGIIGQQFHEWTVLSYEGSARIKVRCSCGIERISIAKDVITGKSKRCGTCKGHRAVQFLKDHQNHFGPNNPNWKGTQEIPLDYFSQIKRGAEARGIPFNLTIENFQAQWTKQQGRCAYTGQALHFKKSRNKNRGKHEASSTRASLDRIDNKKPYEIGNIQFITAPLNLMKSDYSEVEFVELITSVVKFLSR